MRSRRVVDVMSGHNAALASILWALAAPGGWRAGGAGVGDLFAGDLNTGGAAGCLY